MSIETYTDGIMFLHLGLFICLVITGIAVIWRKICGKKTKCWWLVPCAMYYSVFAVIGTQVMVVLTALFIMLMGMIVWSFITFLQVD